MSAIYGVMHHVEEVDDYPVKTIKDKEKKLMEKKEQEGEKEKERRIRR